MSILISKSNNILKKLFTEIYIGAIYYLLALRMSHIILFWLIYTLLNSFPL